MKLLHHYLILRNFADRRWRRRKSLTSLYTSERSCQWCLPFTILWYSSFMAVPNKIWATTVVTYLRFWQSWYLSKWEIHISIKSGPLLKSHISNIGNHGFFQNEKYHSTWFLSSTCGQCTLRWGMYVTVKCVLKIKH